LSKAQSVEYICEKFDRVKKTLEQYDQVSAMCRDLFEKKTKDYGTAWRILRLSSLTDQLFIKARRIRSIEEGEGNQKVEDSVESEYIGLVNYSVLALLQMHLPTNAPLELDPNEVVDRYDQEIRETRELMIAKNHDYGEVWAGYAIKLFDGYHPDETAPDQAD
jgi:hypothetical protein